MFSRAIVSVWQKFDLFWYRAARFHPARKRVLLGEFAIAWKRKGETHVVLHSFNKIGFITMGGMRGRHPRVCFDSDDDLGLL